MAQYKGIIAGIGDKPNKINLISPQFDARIYNFIIGKNCIIDGLELNNKTLSAGACVCQGYRGVIDTSIKLVTTMGYIYGVFKVNFDNDKPDEFYIETSSTKIERKDDILHGTGVYYLELYYNGLVRLPRDYPNSAVYADKSQFVSNTIGEKATATTQDVNDNSTKVATTEYVHKVIDKELDAVNIDESYTIYWTNEGTTSGWVFNRTTTTFKLQFKKRATLCLIDSISASIKDDSDSNAGNLQKIPENSLITTLPSNCKPQQNITLGYIGLTANNIGTHIVININGEIRTTAQFQLNQPRGSSFSLYSSVKNVGYETN